MLTLVVVLNRSQITTIGQMNIGLYQFYYVLPCSQKQTKNTHPYQQHHHHVDDNDCIFVVVMNSVALSKTDTNQYCGGFACKQCCLLVDGGNLNSV